MKDWLRRSAYVTLYRVGTSRRRAGVSVLTYHSIDESGSPISTSRDEFEIHMRWLSEVGYSTRTVAELVGQARDQLTISEKIVVLTFDDGYRNLHDVGQPFLEKAGYTATLFVCAGYIGGANAWSGQHPTVAAMSLLSKGLLCELADAGFEIGSHGMNHLRLTVLSDQELRREIADSRKALEDILGRSVVSFCYPFGDYDGRVMGEVQRAGYRCACTTEWGRFTLGANPFAMKRLSVGGGTDVARLRLLSSSGASLLAKMKTALPGTVSPP